MKLRLAALVAGASGFIALSYEILWYRLYSFVSWGAPRTVCPFVENCAILE